VKVVAAAADLVRPRARGVVVLSWHRVGGGSGGQVDMPVPQFRAQAEELAATGRVVSLDDGLAAAVGGSPADGRDPIVLTFDDGTADFADKALPVLERLGLPVTVYLATAYIEEQRPFPWGAPPLSWSALRDARDTGLVTVGSHTHGHLVLDRVSPAEAADDLDRSVDLIGTHIGQAPAHFAYPKAVAAPPAVAAEIRTRFRSAAVAGTRPNRYGRTDPYRLARSPLQVSDGPYFFRRKAAGGMAAEGALRQMLDRRRYAESVT
jgi:peptidoglycan/xylan/chitin deacetylase (PgdA/CDA1 family)